MVESVEVKNERLNKIYLGERRNTVTKVIYHNAESQTRPLAKSNVENICSRAVQCIETSDESCQTRVRTATQMWRVNYMSEKNDKYSTPNRHKGLEEAKMQLKLNEKAKIIQRAYRSWRIQRMIKQCAEHYRKIINDCEKYKKEKLQRHKRRNNSLIIRYLFPQSRADFAMLYGLIETWRKKKSNEMKEEKNFDVDAGRVENCRNLMEQIIMLKNVEKLRQYIVEEYRKKKLLKFLTFHCKSVKWNGYKGERIEIVTLRVQKARELKTLHDSLCCNDRPVEERIEILLHLEKTLDNHNCNPAINLADLINQEIALLFSGIKMKLLTYLQERVSLAFLYFIHQSHDCCMKIENAKDMELAEPIDEDKLVCHSCKQLLSRNKFAVHARVKKLTKCRACSWLHQQNTERVDYDPYNYLLDEIRTDERRKNCYSNLLYFIQETDIYYLVKIIWHGRSIVSEVDDISCLRLGRFHLNCEWSPWNCILLTDEEYEVHYNIKNLNNLYSKPLLSRIYLLHKTAKVHFGKLVEIEKNIYKKTDDMKKGK